MFRTETQHALRALAALAAGEAPLSIAVLAERTGAPAPTLGKVLHRLSLLGFVAGRTGRGGGYRLARPAEELHLVDLVQAFEGPGFARQCLFGMPRCSDKQPCPLHSTWAPVREGLLELVERRSVADLAPRGSLAESAR